MKTVIRIFYGSVRQEFNESNIPFCFGVSSKEEVILGNEKESEPAAWLGSENRQFFIEPVSGGASLRLNKKILTASAWLVDGGHIHIKNSAFKVSFEGSEILLTSVPIRKNFVFTPRIAYLISFLSFLLLGVLFVLTAVPVQITTSPSPDKISFEGFLPSIKIGKSYLTLPGSYRLVALKKGYQNIEETIVVQSGSDSKHEYAFIELPGLLKVISMPISEARVMVDDREVGKTPLESIELMTGSYELKVEAERYLPATQFINIEGKGVEQQIDVVLKPGWGTLSLESSPDGADVWLNGKRVGQTTFKSETMAGTYKLELRKKGWKTIVNEVEVELGKTLRLPEFVLQKLDSITPKKEAEEKARLEAKLKAKEEQIKRETEEKVQREVKAKLEAKLKAHAEEKAKLEAMLKAQAEEKARLEAALKIKEEQEKLEAKTKAREEQASLRQESELTEKEILLKPEPQKIGGKLELTSVPTDAKVILNDEFLGHTPISLTIKPNQDNKLSLSKRGTLPTSRSIRMGKGETRKLEVKLELEYGVLFIASQPADALLKIDNKEMGLATQRLRLTTLPHQIEIIKPGYESFKTVLEPTVGVSKRLDVQLKKKVGKAKIKSKQKLTIKTSEGQVLRRILLKNPVRFTMGSSRREPSRRSNERQYNVELTRTFYVSEKEVTNSEFQKFRPDHDSGNENGFDLNEAKQPVASIKWSDAASYLNWLSEKEGLTPAYEEKDGKMTPKIPLTTGYRLLTEAEWVFIARYEGKEVKDEEKTEYPLIFPWGNKKSLSDKVGNFADTSAIDIVPLIIQDYNDGHAVSAPVGEFPPNALGIYDLGGNVSEWCHDYYDIYSGSKTLRDPTGPTKAKFHVIRGSNWRHGSIRELRFSYRNFSEKPRNNIGFRIARYAEE